MRNIVLLHGRPTLFDGIEFNDAIACIDVRYDLTPRGQVARRNQREYIAAVIVLVGWGSCIRFAATAIRRLAAVLVLVATVFVVYQLHVRGSVTPLPVDLARLTSLVFHRAQLERQRALLQIVWLWYLMPFAPGMSAFLNGLAFENPARVPVILAAGVVNVVGSLVHVMSRRGADARSASA